MPLTTPGDTVDPMARPAPRENGTPHGYTAEEYFALAAQGVIGAGAVASVRVQLPLVTAPDSAPGPDVAVVPGRDAAYDQAHPASAILVVEVADTSLIQDRLTKASIYAAAGIP